MGFKGWGGQQWQHPAYCPGESRGWCPSSKPLPWTLTGEQTKALVTQLTLFKQDPGGAGMTSGPGLLGW